MYFRYFVIIAPWKRAGPFIWTNLNPLHPRMLCAKFGWNWPSSSGEEVENVNSLQTYGQTDRRTDGQTDDGRQVIRKAHLSFQLRWSKQLQPFHDVVVYKLHEESLLKMRENITYNWSRKIKFRIWLLIWLCSMKQNFENMKITENVLRNVENKEDYFCRFCTK